MNKYLYIDDENDCRLLINGLNYTKHIAVEHMQMNKNMSIDEVLKLIKGAWDDIDGIIFDMRLNGTGVNRIACSASTLAQNLRTYCVEEHKTQKPFALCSTDVNLRSTNNEDLTSHDLYDFVFDKDFNINADAIASQLSCLADAYKILSEDKKTPSDILSYDVKDLDPAIAETLECNQGNPNAIVRFLLNELFAHPGVLIDELTMAARLGIDAERSDGAYRSLIEKMFEMFGYKGLLAGYEHRYWAQAILQWYESISGGAFLPLVPADERVSTVGAKLGIDGLVSAKPLQYESSTMYWAKCMVTGKPIDPVEAFTVQETSPLKSWQEPQYVSMYAIIEHLNDDKFTLSRCEGDRFQLRKDLINSSSNGEG